MQFSEMVCESIHIESWKEVKEMINGKVQYKDKHCYCYCIIQKGARYQHKLIKTNITNDRII